MNEKLAERRTTNDSFTTVFTRFQLLKKDPISCNMQPRMYKTASQIPNRIRVTKKETKRAAYNLESEFVATGAKVQSIVRSSAGHLVASSAIVCTSPSASVSNRCAAVASVCTDASF